MRCECIIRPAYSSMSLGKPQPKRCENDALYFIKGKTAVEKKQGDMGLCEKCFVLFMEDNPRYQFYRKD